MGHLKVSPGVHQRHKGDTVQACHVERKVAESISDTSDMRGTMVIWKAGLPYFSHLGSATVLFLLAL